MLALPTHLNSIAFAMASSLVAHVLFVYRLPLPIPANPPIYLRFQKSIVNMISLSNWINDLPEEIHISI